MFQLLDHSVQKIVDQGFTIEQAEYALKMNRNNIGKALKSLGKFDSKPNRFVFLFPIFYLVFIQNVWFGYLIFECNIFQGTKRTKTQARWKTRRRDWETK